MKTPHIHAELIKAWADGAEIEVFNYGQWWPLEAPFWEEETQYRIKPEPKPDVVSFGFVAKKDSAVCFFSKQVSADNLKLTFDAETGKLKSAEVLK